MRANRRWVAVGGFTAVFCSLAIGQPAARQAATPLNVIIDRLEKAQSAVRSQTSYVVIREYRLSGSKSLTADSNVIAEVDFRPPASKNYRIEKSTGSNRGPQIVRRILDHEVESTSNGSNLKTALGRENYDFTYLGEVKVDGQDCYLLGIKPKRKDKDLIAGKVWVDKSTFFVRRIEGELVKTPSMWLKSVHVKLAFADISGTWLQTSMEAVADVRLAGPHTLTSRILDYRAADVVATATTPTRTTARKP